MFYRSIKMLLLAACLIVAGTRLSQTLFAQQDEEKKEEGLLAHWKLDEGSGAIAGDSSQNGNNGVFSGQPVWEKGKVGGALSFDGVDDYLKIEDNNTQDFAATQSFTLSAWIKTKTASKAQLLFDKYGGNPNYSFQIQPDGKMLFAARGEGGGEKVFSGSRIVTNGGWHFVAVVRDAAAKQIHIYVDGKLDATQSDTMIGSLGSNASLTLATGGLHAGGFYFKGKLDELKIYNRALSVEEILENYKKAGGGLMAYLKFDEEVSGTSAVDSSGEEQTGTLVNGPLRVAGIKGNALEFDGADDYVWIENSPLFHFGASDSFSLSTWVHSCSSNEMRLFDYYGGMPYYSLQVSPKTKFVIRGELGGETSSQGVVRLNDCFWHHLAITRNTEKDLILFYVDGVLDGGGKDGTEGAVALGARFVIGASGINAGGSRWFKGKVDEVKVFSRVLDTKEIKAEYDSFQKPPLPDVPLVHLKLNETLNGESKIEDASGNNYHARKEGYPATIKGRVGKAVQFEPKNEDVISLNIPTLDTKKDARTSVALWTRFDNSAAGILFGFGTYYLGVDVANNRFGYSTGANDLFGIATDGLLKKWFHVVAEFNNGLTSLNKLYINCEERAIARLAGAEGAPYKGLITPAAKLSGWPASGAGKVRAAIDDVQIFNGALTPDQVKDICKKASLLAHWNFGEIEGTEVKDITGNENPGTLNGPISVGPALQFDGVDDYIDFGNVLNLEDSPFTIEAVVKWEVTEGIQSLVSKGTGAGPGIGYRLLVGTNNDILPAVGDGKTSLGDYTESKFTLDVWHHVAMVEDDSKLMVYVDGKLEGEWDSSSLQLTDNDHSLWIGGQEEGNKFFFKGQIKEVKIYSLALTDEEIQEAFAKLEEPAVEEKVEEEKVEEEKVEEKVEEEVKEEVVAQGEGEGVAEEAETPDETVGDEQEPFPATEAEQKRKIAGGYSNSQIYGEAESELEGDLAKDKQNLETFSCASSIRGPASPSGFKLWPAFWILILILARRIAPK